MRVTWNAWASACDEAGWLFLGRNNEAREEGVHKANMHGFANAWICSVAGRKRPWRFSHNLIFVKSANGSYCCPFRKGNPKSKTTSFRVS